MEPRHPRSMAGEFVTKNFEFDGGRAVSVYLPPEHPEMLIFAGDGQVVSSWGEYLETTGVPPTMIVGVHGLSDEMARLQEYSPVFDAARFAAHEAFFVEEVGEWVNSNFGVALPAERTAIFGASAGGELALTLGLRHSDVYGLIFCASPGAGFKPPETLPVRIPRTYIVADTEEPFFLENATRWADALRKAGADVVMEKRAGTHGGDFWRQELPRMIAWPFER